MRRLAAAGPQEAELAYVAGEAEKGVVLKALSLAPCCHSCCRPEYAVAKAGGAAAVDAFLAALMATPPTGGEAVISATGKTVAVIYLGRNIEFLLPLKQFRCSRCKLAFLPEALDVNAFPSSPASVRENGAVVGYTRFFSLGVLKDFATLNDGGGLSLMAYAAHLEEKLRSLSELRAVHLKSLGQDDPRAGEFYEPHPVDPRTFANAYFASRRTLAAISNEKEMGMNCFAGVFNCPSCTTTVSPDGKLNPSEIVTVIVDASVTPSSNPKAAMAAHAAQLKPTVRKYFRCEAEASGAISSSSVLPPTESQARPAAVTGPGAGAAGRGPGPGAFAPAVGSVSTAAAASTGNGGGGLEEGDGDMHGVGVGPHRNPIVDDSLRSHHNPLTCDDPRHSSVPEGTHAKGVVGAVCSCGKPVLGSYESINTHENYGCYDRQLKHLVLTNPIDTIRKVGLDYGCLYKVHFVNFFGEDLPYATYVRADEVLFLVDWLHAKGHKAICRFQNGAFYIVNTGRRTGVDMERLFAKVNSFFFFFLLFDFICGGPASRFFSSFLFHFCDFDLCRSYVSLCLCS